MVRDRVRIKTVATARPDCRRRAVEGGARAGVYLLRALGSLASMNSDTSTDELRPGALAAVSAGRLSIPDVALLAISGGAQASREALARWLSERGATIVGSPAEAALPLEERLLTCVDLVKPGDTTFHGHAIRDSAFSEAKHAHVAPIALEPGANEERIASLIRAGFADAVALAPQSLPDALHRRRLPEDHRDLHGPFDIIGDVHGCHAELIRLLRALGYRLQPDGEAASHPDGRTILFVGDLCDRGPENAAVLRAAIALEAQGMAKCVVGNHDDRMLRRLKGRSVSLSHGLAETMEELDRESAAFRDEVAAFVDRMPSHLWLDEGRLVVAHAGLKQAMHGRHAKSVRSFAMYGETTGERDEYGLPIRLDWARDYSGEARVVHGHTPMAAPGWSNNALCIDSGCVFGGLLTAYRWPENVVLATPADRRHCAPPRPLAAPVSPATFALTND